MIGTSYERPRRSAITGEGMMVATRSFLWRADDGSEECVVHAGVTRVSPDHRMLRDKAAVRYFVPGVAQTRTRTGRVSSWRL